MMPQCVARHMKQGPSIKREHQCTHPEVIVGSFLHLHGPPPPPTAPASCTPLPQASPSPASQSPASAAEDKGQCAVPPSPGPDAVHIALVPSRPPMRRTPSQGGHRHVHRTARRSVHTLGVIQTAKPSVVLARGRGATRNIVAWTRPHGNQANRACLRCTRDRFGAALGMTGRWGQPSVNARALPRPKCRPPAHCRGVVHGVWPAGRDGGRGMRA